MLGIAWLAAFVGGLLPFTLAIQRANKLGIRSWAYFAGAGTLAALATLVLLAGASAFACGEEESSSNMLGIVLLLAASGAPAAQAPARRRDNQARLETSVRIS